MPQRRHARNRRIPQRIRRYRPPGNGSAEKRALISSAVHGAPPENVSEEIASAPAAPETARTEIGVGE